MNTQGKQIAILFIIASLNHIAQSQHTTSIFMGERSMSTIRRFLRDESGATAIEYGLIAALVSVVIIVTLTMLGNNLNLTFKAVANELKQ
jgi:pilus assembly protein Flp/PilA